MEKEKNNFRKHNIMCNMCCYIACGKAIDNVNKSCHCFMNEVKCNECEHEDECPF